jgi:hypothetical protein
MEPRLLAGFLYMSDLNTLVSPALDGPKLTYTIVVRCGADQQSQALSAFRFTQQVLSQGHQVLRVFFYQQGVLWSSRFRVMPQDELNLTALWQQLSLDYMLNLAYVSQLLYNQVLWIRKNPLAMSLAEKI